MNTYFMIPDTLMSMITNGWAVPVMDILDLDIIMIKFVIGEIDHTEMKLESRIRILFG